MNNRNTDIPQVLLCAVAALCAVVLSVFLLLSHRQASRELNSISARVEETAASWKQINDEKLEVKKTLRDVENRIADAEDAVAAARKREKDIAQYKEEIADLESRIAELENR